MDRRRVGGWALGLLVGVALVYTAGQALSVALTTPTRVAQAVMSTGDLFGAGSSFDFLNQTIAGEAAAVSSPGLPTADFGSRLSNLLKSIGNVIGASLERAGSIAAKNALRRYLGDLAKGTAEWIANGGRGRTPLFQYKSFYSYLADERDAATAEFLDSLGTAYGVDVCNPELGAKLVIHYAQMPGGKLQTPRCSLQTIRENWSQLLPNSDAFLQRFSASLEPDQNDLGVAITLQRKLVTDRESKAEAAILERLESQGLKPLKDLAGNIITPATAVGEQIRQTLGLGALAESSFIGDPVADAIGIFVNTLGSRLQQKWLQKGFVNIADVFDRTGSSGLFGGAGRYSTAEPRFAALANVELGTAGVVDVVSELTTCTDPAHPGYGNQCVADQAFGQAIQQQLTVRDALDRGLLRGEWAFGYLGDGSEPSYGTGYSYSSMVILRAKRVLPVGWELAAQAARGFGTAVTLEHVVHCYEDPAAADDGAKPLDCQVNGVNPFYHLVDPNWVLKAPQAYCVRRGASSELLTEQYVCNQDSNGDGAIDCVNLDSTTQLGRTDTEVNEPDGRDQYYRLLQRATYCADEQSCIAENPDGSCRAYGYCFEEKQTFTLGDGACPSQFASCVGVTTPTGQRTAYLQDSLQTCSASANGCQWYSRRRSGTSWSPAPADRIYLNGEAASCSGEDAGCRKLLRFGQGVNLVPNGGFEQFDRHSSSLPSSPDNFFISSETAQGQAFSNAAEVFEGATSFKLVAPGTLSALAETGAEVAGRTFTASVATRGCTGGTLSLLDGDGGNVGSPAGVEVDPNDQWHTVAVTGTTQAPGTSLTVRLSGLAGTDCYVDSLALAEGSQAATQAYGAGRSVHMSSRATQCTQDDVGCRAFTPVSGDPTVFGRVTANDYCPAQCVGYANYTPLANTFEEREAAPAPDPVNFIPSTARSCSAVDVGCSEFTSLADVPEGGERVAYFSQVQQCVTREMPNVATYYTWEGSDTAGYQLRVWQLLRTNQPSDQTPCTNLSLDPAVQPPVCQDTAANQATCAANDPDPDCREVFDSSAASHRVRWSRVVQATDDCRQYRRTGTDFVYNVSPSLARRCPASANGCRQYRGATGGNTRTALLADFETSSASGWGGSGTIALTGEALQVGGHSLMVQGADGSVTLRRNAPVEMRPGHQYMLSVWVKGSDRMVAAGYTSFRSGFGRLLSRLGAQPASAQSPENLVFSSGATPIGSDWQLLRLGPVTPTTQAGTLTFDVTVSLAPGLRSAYFDNVVLREVTSDTFVVQGSWDTPQACDNPPGLPEGTESNPRTEPGAMVGCARYRSGGQQVTLRSFSRLCAEENVGCQAFMDTANSASPFAQRFNATCSLGSPAASPTVCSSGGYQRCVVGVGSSSCRYTETANVGVEWLASPSDPEDRVQVSGDRVVYYVDSPAAYCSPEVAGCTALGLPRVNRQAWSGTGDAPSGAIGGWQDVFKVVSPDQFGTTLCTGDQLWCTTHPLSDGGSITFRDPLGASPSQSRTCEYRTGVEVNGQLRTGWFRSGTDQGCRAPGDYTLPYSYAPGYDRFVGICPAQYSGCTDYRNPQPYITGGQVHNYFLRSSVDSSSCNGLVDVAGGCMLFRDPGQPALYSSRYSYPPNRLPGQAPVATSTLDTNVVLKVQRDRSCSQWYSCGSSVAVPGSATGQRVCTSLSSCSQLDPATNQCANLGGATFPVGTAGYADEFTFQSPADSAQWRNLSGYIVPGIQFSGGPGLVSRGYTPYSYMDQLGLSAEVRNGGFDDASDGLVAADGVGWERCMAGDPPVSDSQACTLAVAANRVGEGRASLRLSTAYNSTTTLDHAPIALAPGSTYAVSVRFNTVDLLSGRVTLEAVNSAGATVLTLSQASGLGWQQQLGQFTATSNVTLRLSASRDAAGSAYVDEVKVEPVLQVNSQPRYVGQQCRVYPRGDAPSCRYTQPEGEYRGIAGYCVLPDPRNPGRCVQWWPVDVVAGQSYDVFGETISLTGRTPLRYCTEAAGNAFDSDGNGSGDYWQSGDSTQLKAPAPYNFYAFRFNNFDGSTGASVTDYCDPSSTDYPVGYTCQTRDDPFNPFDTKHGIPNAGLWQVHWSELANIYITSDRGNEYQYPYSFLGELRYHTFEYHEPTVSYTEFGFWSDWRRTGEGEGWLFIGVDRSTGRINRFLGYANDTHGEGEGATMSVDFVRKEQCSVLAEVRRDETHAAWYDRFNGGTFASSSLALAPGNDVAPYGAASANVADSVELATCDPSVAAASSSVAGSVGCALPVGKFNVALDGSQAERAGTPLACADGTCGVPQCTQDRNNRCDTGGQTTACFSAVVAPSVSFCAGTPTGSTVPTGNRVDGAVRISQVFARSYVTWTLNSATGQYQRNDCIGNATIQNAMSTSPTGVDAATGCWDRRKLLNQPLEGTANPPRPRVPAISVNGQPPEATSADATVGSTVELRFSSRLNADRLPLRFILVDWGDGSRTVTSRLSINNQPDVNTGHLFTHVYTTLPTTTCPTTGEPCATIRVQVEDNWGFCNGNPTAATYSILNETMRTDTAGCFGPLENARWTRATTSVRFASGGGGGGGVLE